MECVPDLAFLQMAAASNSDMFNKMLWHPSPSAAAAAAAAAAATTSPNSSASATSGTMKQRKTNFTSREVEALLNAVADRKDTVLFGVAGGIGWARAWHEVAQQVSAVEGIHRSESDVRKKWTYLKWEAKNTSKPGRDPTSRAVLDILTTQMRGDQPSNSLLEQLLVPGSPSSPNQSRSTVSPVPIAPKKQSQSSSQSVSSTNSTAQDRQTAQNLQIQQSSQLPQPPEVCLKWNSYHSNMRATFPSLLNNEQFVDVTLACEGRSIKCHKVMLSACSSYFEELLSQNPCQHPIVFMRDLKFWEVQALVEFMYSGEVNVTQDRLPSLLAAADALQIKGLAGPSTGSNSAEDTEDDVIHHVQQQQKRVRKRKSTNPTAYPVRSQCVSQNSKQNVEKVQPTLQHQLKKAHSTPKSTHGVLSSSGYSPPSKTRRDEDPSPNSPLALVKDEPLDLGIDSKNQNRHKTPEPPQTKNEKDENGLCDDEDDDRPDDDAYEDDDKRYDNGNDDDHPSSRESTPKIDK